MATAYTRLLEQIYSAVPSDANETHYNIGEICYSYERARRAQFFPKHKYYETGNQSSSHLAHIVRQNNTSPSILSIKDSDGSMLSDRIRN